MIFNPPKKRGFVTLVLTMLKGTLWMVTLFFIVLCVLATPIVREIWYETIGTVQLHRNYITSHSGWSFPGKIYSAATPLDVPKQRRIAHAKIRGYELKCPAVEAGQYCDEDGEVIPRGGIFLEGMQPSGKTGWTRPLAFEPVLLADLIGEESEIREYISIDDVPSHLIAALLASEDADFYNHYGVNFTALIRATIANIQGGGFEQGASTLTMQVVRNLTQDKKKTISRKLREMVAAIALDSHLTKREILEMYINIPYLGQYGDFSICGFESASQYYFGISARELSISQAATLVGILPSPGSFRPDKYPQKALRKRNRVLQLMRANGFDIGSAMQDKIELKEYVHPSPKHPAYVQAVRVWLEQNLSPTTIYGSGLRVFTSMDLVLQKRTEDFFSEELPKMQELVGMPLENKMEGATTVISPTTGELLAVYGGTQLQSTDFSRATQARRQAGSSLKPLVYTLGFEQKDEKGEYIWKSFSTVTNARRTFKNTSGWRPRNNGEKYSPISTLTAGLVWSQNIATASLLESIGGPEFLIDFAKRFRFDTKNWPNELGLALGQAEVTPFEMTRFVASIANGGRFTNGQPVLAAIDLQQRNHVKTLAMDERIVDENAIFLTRELMRLVVLAGTGGGSRSRLDRLGYKGESIGKTGTTDQSKDLWFVGSTPTYAGALWIGFDIPTTMPVSSSDVAAPLWGWWMRELHKDIPYEKFDAVFGDIPIKRKWLCIETGRVPNDSCRTIGMPALKGQRPTHNCKEEHPKEEEKVYENFWARRKRIQAERQAAKEQGMGNPTFRAQQNVEDDFDDTYIRARDSLGNSTVPLGTPIPDEEKIKEERSETPTAPPMKLPE